MKFKTSISFTVAVVLALITAKVGMDMMSKYGHGTVRGKRVVVATKDMDPGYVIDAADVALQEVPTAMSTDKTFHDLKDVIGRTVVSTVVTSYPIADNVLAPAGSGAGMQAMVPQGMRLVTVDVSESSGVAGLLTPGCKVDVIATLRDGDQSVAKTVVENVKVQFVQRGRATAGRVTSTSDQNNGPVKTVSLLVTPGDAVKIELANSEGKPRLVLRGNADTSESSGAQIGHNQLLGKPDVEPTPPPAPAPTDVFANQPPAAKGRSVQIIQGGNEKTVTFDEEGNQEAGGNGAKSAASATGKGEKPAGVEQRTLSGAAPGKAPGKDAGRGNL